MFIRGREYSLHIYSSFADRLPVNLSLIPWRSVVSVIAYHLGVTVNLFIVLQLIFHRAGCLVQPTRIDFDSCELAAMIRFAGVNRIIQFTAILRRHLEDAREGLVEPELLNLFKKSRQLTYAGMPLATELEDWAVAEGIPVTVHSNALLTYSC